LEPFFSSFFGFFSSDTCQESRNQRQAGIMPAHPWKCPSHRKDFSTVMHLFNQISSRS
jgi:hypothetical protein